MQLRINGTPVQPQGQDVAGSNLMPQVVDAAMALFAATAHLEDNANQPEDFEPAHRMLFGDILVGGHLEWFSQQGFDVAFDEGGDRVTVEFGTGPHNGRLRLKMELEELHPHTDDCPWCKGPTVYDLQYGDVVEDIQIPSGEPGFGEHCTVTYVDRAKGRVTYAAKRGSVDVPVADVRKVQS